MVEPTTTWVTNSLNTARSIHILGCGLNPEKPAHQAIHDLNQRGWRLVPIHPKDAGASILAKPIRPRIDDGIIPEIVVLFLAPERAKSAVLEMLVKYDRGSFPLIWFQHGAESAEVSEMLESNNIRFVSDDCIVRYIQRNELSRSPAFIATPWFRQIADADDSGCSVWQAYSGHEDAERVVTKLEWVGDLVDLEQSNHSIAKYIRSMRNQSESLLDTAVSLA